MANNPIVLPLAVVVAENAGASNNQALLIAVLASTMRSPMMALMLALAIPRNKQGLTTASLRVASGGLLTTGAGPGGGGSGGSSSGGSGASGSTSGVSVQNPHGVTQLLEVGAPMPSFLGMTALHAARWAAALGLIYEFDVGDTELEDKVVVGQKPAVGAHIRKSRIVNLEMGAA
jgi:hypothetical protein